MSGVSTWVPVMVSSLGYLTALGGACLRLVRGYVRRTIEAEVHPLRTELGITTVDLKAAMAGLRADVVELRRDVRNGNGTEPSRESHPRRGW